MTDPDTVAPLLPLLVAGERMTQLRRDLQAELARHPDSRVQALAEDLAELRSDDVINIVLVGQHDAGKSLLVRCLTGRDDIPVGAGPLTDRSTAYEWNGHRLVDTPGVQAGVRAEHDSIAEQALSAADVVLFVLTVEGLDDVLARYFARVRRQLRSLRGLVIVVNKALSERSARDANEADLARAVGPSYELVPVVWTDARRWAEAASSRDPERARAESQLRELAETVTGIVRDRGATVRLLTPLRAWSDAAQEALRLLSGQKAGHGDLQQLAGLAEHLTAQHEDALDDVSLRADEAVVALVAGLRTAGPDLDRRRLEQLVQQASDVFDRRVAEDGVRRDEALLSQVALRIDGASAAVSDPGVRRLLQESLARLSQAASGEGARPGGAAHAAVTRAWHAVGGKFRPHGAVKATRALGKWAGRANVALTVSAAARDLYGQYREGQEQAELAQRIAGWDREAQDLAEGIVADWRTAVERAVEELHEVRMAEVARQRLGLLLDLTAADETARAFAELDERCGQLILELTEVREPAESPAPAV